MRCATAVLAFMLSSTAALADPPARAPSVAALEAQCVRGDAAACRAWTIRFNRGDVPSQDEPRLIRRFDAACTAKKIAACYAEGVVLWTSARDEKRALALFARACDAGSTDGCWELGDRESGAARITAHRKACALGYAPSCAIAALDLVDGDIREALKLARRGCELGDATACKIARDLAPPVGR